MKILGTIWKFFSKNKKNIAYIAFFLIFLFSCNDLAFAADEAKKSDWVIKLLSWILGIAASLIWVLTMLIWLFLRPEWTSGSVIWLDTQLKVMWILISNVVYFVFAFIFVTIAFMNIVWSGGELYQLKKAIPKFIIWVLIVPFSWFFVQFILSLSSILTVAVLSLPFDSFADLDIKSKEIELCNEKWSKINLSATWWNIIKCTEWEKQAITIWKFLEQNNNWWLYSIMTIYTYWVMKIDDKWLVKAKELNTIKDVWSLWLKWIFDLIFIIVYGLLCIAMFLAFMTRWFALWFYMMFSPVFWLLYYLWKWKDWIWSWASKNFNLHEFIALAFVPVYVAWALSFWLLFLLVAGKWFSENKWPDALIKFTWESLKINNNTFTSDAIKSAGDKWFGWWFKWPIGAMVLEMLWLAVMWMAVMVALKSSSITASVTDPIAKFGDSIWELIKKAPTYAPILPGWLSTSWLQQIWWQANTYFQNKASDKARDFMKENNLFQSADNDKSDKSRKLATQLLHNPNVISNQQEWINHLRTYKDFNDFKEDKRAIELLTQLWLALKIDPKDIKYDNAKELSATLELIKTKDNGSNNLWLNKITNLETQFFTWKNTKSQSTDLPKTINKNEPAKVWDPTTFNIYAYNKDWKQEWSKTDIIIDKWKVTNWNIAEALKSYKDTKWKDWITEILQKMWIIDQTEIDKILKEIFKP